MPTTSKAAHACLCTRMPATNVISLCGNDDKADLDSCAVSCKLIGGFMSALFNLFNLFNLFHVKISLFDRKHFIQKKISIFFSFQVSLQYPHLKWLSSLSVSIMVSPFYIESIMRSLISYITINNKKLKLSPNVDLFMVPVP